MCLVRFCALGVLCRRQARLIVTVQRVLALTGGAGCSPNLEASNDPIVEFSPESWSTVCERQPKRLGKLLTNSQGFLPSHAMRFSID